MPAIDAQLDDVRAVFAERRLHLHDSELVCEQRSGEVKQDESAFHCASSNVTEAHQLSQSAPESGGAGSMCTALISQKPGRGRWSVARPRASVRARTACSGLSLLMATP